MCLEEMEIELPEGALPVVRSMGENYKCNYEIGDYGYTYSSSRFYHAKGSYSFSNYNSFYNAVLKKAVVKIEEGYIINVTGNLRVVMSTSNKELLEEQVRRQKERFENHIKYAVQAEIKKAWQSVQYDPKDIKIIINVSAGGHRPVSDCLPDY